MLEVIATLMAIQIINTIIDYFCVYKKIKTLKNALVEQELTASKNRERQITILKRLNHHEKTFKKFDDILTENLENIEDKNEARNKSINQFLRQF